MDNKLSDRLQEIVLDDLRDTVAGLQHQLAEARAEAAALLDWCRLAMAALNAVQEDLNWHEQHTRGLTHATREVLRGVEAALAAAPPGMREE